ncbi:hypothetical protein F441_14805 [Phytophthora nicotianae CJ01A1]|uniref:Uncharacterized protein n=1 Tax=Phytophthora nicotianae CJ01A1 TaxID=1317063 RepID=W2WFE8_PHYNI|nr:hypothetical protein F441_14805 [Phytophthora nicotianae CJ01A1]
MQENLYSPNLRLSRGRNSWTISTRRTRPVRRLYSRS